LIWSSSGSRWPKTALRLRWEPATMSSQVSGVAHLLSGWWYPKRTDLYRGELRRVPEAGWRLDGHGQRSYPFRRWSRPATCTRHRGRASLARVARRARLYRPTSTPLPRLRHMERAEAKRCVGYGPGNGRSELHSWSARLVEVHRLNSATCNPDLSALPGPRRVPRLRTRRRGARSLGWTHGGGAQSSTARPVHQQRAVADRLTDRPPDCSSASRTVGGHRKLPTGGQ
jgi:hypothetical protein